MIKADRVNPNYSYPDEYQSQGEEFLQHYSIEKEIGSGDGKTSRLKSKRDRICRFCGKKYPYVSFSKDAHLISEFLGNKSLFSDFECDYCNATFGKYENDMANFLGIVRTVQSVKGKKVPKFKSPNKKLVIESLIEEEQKIIKIRRFDGLDKTFHFDKEKQQTVISYTKNPYTPLSVYKAILKMGLSLIDEKHIPNYSFALEYLRTSKYDLLYSGFATVTAYMMPLTFQFQQPGGMLFYKKFRQDPLFSHVFYLFALNFIFQIPMPFNRRDRDLYQMSGAVTTLWCPPLFGNNKEVNPHKSMSFNFNSNQRVYNEKEDLIIPTPLGEYDKARFLNKETGEISEEEFDPTKIIGIDLLRIDNEENQ